VEDLAAAEDADVMAAWAGLGYYARARNLLKCARVVAERGGFPKTEAGLLELPGIGPYTAAAIAAIALGERTVVVDGNVERVISRYFAIEQPLPHSKPAIRGAAAGLTPQRRAGDYAQAMMDLGATVCTAKRPACLACPVSKGCEARISGIAERLPAKVKKAAKPVRRGHAYVVRRSDGAILLETRPEKGLLGGMLGFPGSVWADDPGFEPPFRGDWAPRGEIRHTFTHFHLVLAVHVGAAPNGFAPASSVFVDAEAFDANALPTVMKKVWRAAETVDA